MAMPKPSTITITSRDPVTTYARKVSQGKVIAGPEVRAACNRHLEDLRKAGNWEYRFDKCLAQRVIDFFRDELRLASGKHEAKPFDPLDWQKFILGSLFGWVHVVTGKRRFRMAYVETAKGPLALDTPIPTPSGWTTMGNLEPGDMVFDDQAKPCNVTATSPVFHGRECFKLTFSDGCKIVADAEHKWKTAALRSGLKPGPRKQGEQKTGEYSIKTTAEIAQTLSVNESTSKHPQAKWNHRVDIAPALELPDIDLPIAPYTLGAWLGDGDSDATRITCADEEIIEAIKAEGYAVGKKQTKPGTKAFRLAFGLMDKGVCQRGHSRLEHSHTDNWGRRCRACERERDRAKRNGQMIPDLTVLPLQQRFRGLGLFGNKHIPPEYLRAGTQQRLKLLQGIMDTDGHVSKADGSCEITLCNERLIQDVAELLRTLGYKCMVHESEAKLNGLTVGSRWRINFTAYRNNPPVKLSRKAENLREEPKTRALSLGRMIVDCASIPSVPVKCITVDAESHLFLAGHSMVPTANSGKSPLLAGIGIYLLVADQEPGAEIYVAATTRDQAKIPFRAAAAMHAQSPGLSTRLVASTAMRDVIRLTYHKDPGRKAYGFMTIISSDENQSGPLPHGTLIDELHEWKDAALLNVLEGGMKGRDSR
jgi:hypothetical protein